MIPIVTPEEMGAIDADEANADRLRGLDVRTPDPRIRRAVHVQQGGAVGCPHIVEPERPPVRQLHRLGQWHGPEDTAATLHERIQQAERRLYPLCVGALAEQKIAIKGRQTVWLK